MKELGSEFGRCEECDEDVREDDGNIDMFSHLKKKAKKNDSRQLPARN